LEESALSDCQTTIVVTSIDIHILPLSPCQNFGNFFTNNTSCHYFTEGILEISTVSQFVKKTPYLYTIDPEKFGRGTGKAFLYKAMERFFAICICLACYSTLKDKGLYFHQLPCCYCRKRFHRAV